MTIAMQDQKWGASVGVHHAHEAPDSATVWTESAGLFRRWRDGEHDCLDGLVRVLTPVLWHVARATGLDQDRAEDVVQTAWLTLVRRQESIADPQAISGWMITTARREAWRVAKVEARTQVADDEVIAARTPRQRAAEVDVLVQDEQDRLWTCVQQLTPRCQTLLRIIAFDDRPDYEGIARDLEMPIGSIGPTRGRCLAKLKTLLGDKSGVDHE